MRGRVFRNVVDLVVFSLFLSFTPNVKEASVSRSEKNLGVLTVRNLLRGSYTKRLTSLISFLL